MNVTKEQLIKNLQNKQNSMNIQDFLYYCVETYGSKIALSSSLGAEDQVLTDMIFAKKTPLPLRIFTLDTGRLHPETYEIIERTNSHYNIKIEVYFPSTTAVEQLTHTKGLFSFFESIENRKECCTIRKLEPLSRALKGLNIWITGLRKAQSPTRTDTQVVEWDDAHQLIKLNPLADWSEDQVWDYIHTYKVPYNKLHDRGYPSIGCAPCTRAIVKGADIRSGRWWWENPEHKECGLHDRQNTSGLHKGHKNGS